MKIYRDLSELGNIKRPVLTTGTFDGVHLGHQKIIQRLQEITRKVGGESVLLTFWPHPRMVVFPDDNELKLLNTLEEKAELLEKFGIDHFVVYPFSKSFSRLSAREYTKEILVDGVQVHTVAVGYDHRFGRNREGDFNELKRFSLEFGFQVEEIPAQEVDDINVSSTKIRRALLQGDIKTAQQFLSYPYFLNARVIKGEGIGNTLGYPTANLLVEEPYKLIPKNGVYAVNVSIDGEKHPAMMNIGVRPTVSTGEKQSLEVHILDFSQDIYDQEIRVEFLEFIREEKKFESVEGLKKQLEHDKNYCLRFFSSV